MEKHEVVRQALEAGVQLVFFLYCDNGGIIRGKSTHISSLASRLDTGIGLTVAMQAMSDVDVLQSVDGMGPVGEIRLVPDPTTFTVLPYAPKRAIMMADMLTLDHAVWDACPRSFLQRMVRQAAEMGLNPDAFESKFSRFDAAHNGQKVVARTGAPGMTI